MLNRTRPSSSFLAFFFTLSFFPTAFPLSFSLFPLLIYLSIYLSLLYFRYKKENDEEAPEAGERAGCREESKPATSDKAKAYGGKWGPCACAGTFIPASITTLAPTASWCWLAQPSVFRDPVASRKSRPWAREGGREGGRSWRNAILITVTPRTRTDNYG